MTWRVEWTPSAIASLRQIPWRDAARVAAAVYHLADKGEGELYVMPGDPALVGRLRVGSYRVTLTRYSPGRQLYVWFVYRTW